MNWDAIGAVGESLGAIAVFITLGYLALQVQFARREIARSISQSRAEALRSITLAHATDERLNRLTVRASAAVGEQPRPFVTSLMQAAGLTLEEANAVWWDQTAWWAYRVQVIPHLDELPAGERFEFEARTRANYGSPTLARFWYDSNKGTLIPESVRYIENLLALSA